MKRLVITTIILVLVSLLASSSISLADDATLDFEASLTCLCVGETLSFTITECSGTEPYIAEWDFDADGEVDVTVVGAKNQITLPVNWRYNNCGVFNVILTVTDGTSTTFREEKIEYITVLCCGIEIIPGDVNLDGVIDVLDITYLEMIIASLKNETPTADANLDGVADIFDVTYIEMIIAGLV